MVQRKLSVLLQASWELCDLTGDSENMVSNGKSQRQAVGRVAGADCKEAGTVGAVGCWQPPQGFGFWPRANLHLAFGTCPAFKLN